MAKKTIKLKFYQDINNQYEAAGTITPGMLLTLNSSGKVIPHNVAGGIAEKMFAVEDELQGQTIDNNITSGNPVQTYIVNPGSEVLGILADGQDVDINDVLVSNGDGKLKKMTPDASNVVVEQYPIAKAMESVDMSGSAGADVPGGRIRIRIL